MRYINLRLTYLLTQFSSVFICCLHLHPAVLETNGGSRIYKRGQGRGDAGSEDERRRRQDGGAEVAEEWIVGKGCPLSTGRGDTSDVPSPEKKSRFWISNWRL